MSVAIVQLASGINAFTVPGAITLSAAPTAGNLLIAHIAVNIFANGYTVGTGWTRFDAVGDDYFVTDNTASAVYLYRYVQAGDTATLPAFFSAGATWWAHTVYELSGAASTWGDAFAGGIQSPFTSANQAIPTIKAPLNGSLALTFVEGFNSNTAPTLTGTWTLDVHAANNANYGSHGAASRQMNAGDAIDGTWTTSPLANPFSSSLFMFTPSKAAGPRIARTCHVAVGSGTPGSYTLPFKPDTGNLLIAFIGWADGNQTSPTIASGWTEFASASGGTGKQIIGVYRYVQSSDTATLSAFCSAGSQFFTVFLVELENVSGTWANDFVSSKSGQQASGATQTTTADTTTANNQLAIAAQVNYNGFGFGSQTGFDAKIMDGNNHVNYGSWIVAAENVASSGSSVQCTFTANTSSTPQAYIQAIFFNAPTGTTFNQTISASTTPNASISRATAKPVSINSTPAASIGTAFIPGGGGTVFNQTISASTTPNASIARKTSKSLAASSTPVATVATSLISVGSARPYFNLST